MSREEQMKQAFVEEASDLLPELEEALLSLEDAPHDSDLINRVFRALHTLKGSGNMFGFENIGQLSHEIETIFDQIRNGELVVTKDLLDVTFRAKDHFQQMLDSSADEDSLPIDAFISEIRELAPKQDAPGVQKQGHDLRPREASGTNLRIYRIRFKPPRNIFLNGTNPLGLLSELNDLGKAYVVAHVEDLPDLEEIDPESCYVWWDIILSTDQDKNAILDVFIFVEDESELIVQIIDEGTYTDDEEIAYKRLGEILVDRGDLSPLTLQQVLLSKKPLGELLAETGVVSEESVQAALMEQTTVREHREEKKRQESVSSLRIPAQKLDKLVDLVGELVIAQSRLSQVINSIESQELQEIAEEVERLSSELRDNTLGIRMLPIGTSFGRFRRVVRDLSAELNKEIELVTEGSETELDKTVIEKLNDPLIHLLRNSIDHGIEHPQEREHVGKPKKGTITLKAMHSGGNVIISIMDDGQGIDPEIMREKGIEKGLISSGSDMKDKDLINLIFSPGFSTAKQVSDISGRGVGMDVVKNNIEALRGSVEIDSRKTVGTTISIKLPLTLAIIDGLQVQIEDEVFVLPLSVVEECIELTCEEAQISKQRCFVKVRGEIVPYLSLREVFAISGQAPEIEQVVIVSSNGSQVGLEVDHIIGHYQTVIKSLSKVYQNVQGISGATVRGDGSMALILDVDHLVQRIEKEVQETANSQ
jgi:two-component system chemotaxis sensor kinase CheA